MVPVTLWWSPLFEVRKQFNGLDSLECRTILPALPAVGQILSICAYSIESESKERRVEYYDFKVEEIEFYLEGSHETWEVSINLELVGNNDHEKYEMYQIEVCQVLSEVYGWDPKGVLSEAKSYNDFLSTPARNLELPKKPHFTVRVSLFLINISHPVFTAEPIYTIEDLCRRNEIQILKYNNIGKKSLAFLKEALATKGLKLGMTNDEINDYRSGKFKLGAD